MSVESRRRLDFFVSAFLCLSSLSITNAHANDPEWSWQVSGYSQVFTTKAAAASFMRSLPDTYNRYSKLTKEEFGGLNNGTEYYQYEAPKISPNVGDYSYSNGSGGGPPFGSEGDVVSSVMSGGVQSDPGCPPKSVTPNGQWLQVWQGWGDNDQLQSRAYQSRYYRTASCEEVVSNLEFRRQRSVTCEPGYNGEYSAPGCRMTLTARIQGTQNAACPGSCRGNPTNAANGDKHESVVDYRGPNGLRFERSYHSRSLDGFNRLGVGWTHNYRMRVWADAGQTLYGLIRPDGYREALVATAYTPVTTYVSVDGNGRVAKKTSSSLWQVFNPDGSVESYNTSGALQSIKDGDGRVTTFQYDGQGNLATVTGPFGHTLTFGYDSAGRLSQLVDPAGQITEYSYTDLDPTTPWTANLTSVEYPDGTLQTYHYESPSFPNHLTGVTREDSERYSTFDYDSTGRTILSEHAGGALRHTFAYTNTQTVVTDPLGQTETISFTTDTWLQRRLVSTNKAGLATTRIVPSAWSDPQRRPTQVTDPKGNVTKYVYSTYGLDSKTEAFGTPRARTTSYTYLSNDNDKPLTITQTDRTTSFTYDTNGSVLTRTITDTSVTPNQSRIWTYTYNSFGQVLTEDGPRTDASDVTTYAYYSCTTGNECGQLHTVTNALGHVSTYDSYNAHGQPTQITDANGLVTSLAYDARQRLTDRCVGGALPACSGGELTHLDYWPTGLLKKVANPDGSYLEYLYDAAHRLTEIKDGALNRIVYTLDAMGNRTAENTYDPGNTLRRTHSRVYNSLNQLWKDVNAAGTAAVTTNFGYDNNGNQTSVAAPLSRSSSSLYDELNRLKQITDPASGVTQFSYDANDNLTSVTDPRSLVTSYSYSGFGDLATQTSPDTGLTTNTYDSGGNLDTSTDSRGAVTDYAYDAANRMVSTSFTLGGVTDQTITYGYDSGTNQKGQLTSASDANHDLAWTYDTHGRVTGKGQTVGGVTLAMGYGYNAVGQLGTVTLPSGNVVSFSYNANGQASGLALNGTTTILSGISYDPFGPITGWTWGNGTTASRDFDADGKVTQVDNANGASLKNYAYDDAFRITGVADAMDPTLSWTFGYDSLDRLTSASKTGTTQGWTYDANGNRLTETGTNPSTYTNSTTSNRLSSISGSLARSYGYDAAGNSLSFGSATFTYNNRGRMASASNAGTTATYTYNALGQRIRRATSGATTLYVYDEAGHLLGEYTGSGSLIQETVWLGDMPVATLRANGAGGVNLYYVHADHLNTPRVVTDTANNVRWRWDSDAFGTTPPNQNPWGLGMFEYNLRFPGQQYDAVVGLHYNYFRDYDPAAGRYAQSDPIGLQGGINTYAYVSGNPVELVDPLGQQEFDPGQAGANPFPGRRGPAGGSRDRRTPWLPNHLANRGHCAPYWNVTWYNGGDVERRSLVPLISERKILETDCVIGVECKYKGWIIPSLDWSDRPRAQHFPFSTTYYKEVPKNGGACGCQRN